MTERSSAHPDVVRPEDQRLPLVRTIGYGVQHILAMFGGVIAVPLIVGNAAGLTVPPGGSLVAAALFVSGAATLLQTLGVPFLGSRLPLLQGISFASVSTMLSIIGDDGTGGLRSVFGAVIVAAAVGLLITPFFAQVVRFFPPVVTGSIITVIGLSLMPVAARWITGQPTVGGAPNAAYLDPGDIGLAMATLVVVLVLSKIHKVSRLAVLLGLVVGTLLALAVGKADTSAVGDTAVVGIPHPFAFGAPRFEIGAIVAMTIVILVIMVETTADLLA